MAKRPAQFINDKRRLSIQVAPGTPLYRSAETADALGIYVAAQLRHQLSSLEWIVTETWAGYSGEKRDKAEQVVSHLVDNPFVVTSVHGVQTYTRGVVAEQMPGDLRDFMVGCSDLDVLTLVEVARQRLTRPPLSEDQS